MTPNKCLYLITLRICRQFYWYPSSSEGFVHLQNSALYLWIIKFWKLWYTSENMCCIGWFSHTICAHIVYIPIVIFQKHVNKDIFTCQQRMQWIVVQSHPLLKLHLVTKKTSFGFYMYAKETLTIEAFTALLATLSKWSK